MSEKLSERDEKLVELVLRTTAEIEDERKAKKRQERSTRDQIPRIQEHKELDPDRFKGTLTRLLLDTYMNDQGLIKRIISARYKKPYGKYQDGVLLELKNGIGFTPEYGGSITISERAIKATESRCEVSFKFFDNSGSTSVLKHKGRYYVSLDGKPMTILSVLSYFALTTDDNSILYEALLQYVSSILPFIPGDVDLVGHDNTIDHCMNILRCKHKFIMNRHILLAGPPGCGKTMIAKELAELSGDEYVQFALSSAADWMSWIQVLSKIIKSCERPMIVFIDEIDELGLHRNVNRAHVYELLRLLDGIEDNKNVKIIATTNRPEDLDEALLRVGRLGPVMYIDKPNEDLKFQIFNYFLEKYGISDIDVNSIVEATNGNITGADIRAAIENCIIDGTTPTEMQIRDNLQLIMLAKTKVEALREERRPKYPWEKRR